MTAQRVSRVGAAVFVLGLSLAGPPAVAQADGPGEDTTSGRAESAGPAADSAAQRGVRPAPRDSAGTRGSAATGEPRATGARRVPAAQIPRAAAGRRTVGPTDVASSTRSGAVRSDPPAANESVPQPVSPASGVTRPGVSGWPERSPGAVSRAVANAVESADPRPPAAASAAVAVAAPAAVPPAMTAPAARATAAMGCPACWGGRAPGIGQAITTAVNHLFNSTFDMLSTLPAGPFSNLLEGALVLVRRSLFLIPTGVTAQQVGNALTIRVNTGSVAYVRQDGSHVEVSGLPSFRRSDRFTAAGVQHVVVSNPGDAGCAGFVLESGTIAATLDTTQIDSLRFGSAAAFGGDVSSTVTGGPLTVRDSVRSLGDVAFDAPVLLGNNVQIEAGTPTEPGNVTFHGTVDAGKAGTQSLTVTALGTTTFSEAVGGQAPLASLLTRGIVPLTIAQSVDTRTVPLHYAPDVDEKGKVQVKYGIDVAIGDNPSQLYEFDTGGNAFFAGYNPSFWKNVPLTTDAITVSYTSGNTYDSVVANGSVTIGQGDRTVSTGQPILVGAILTGGNPKKGETFVFTNPDAPPVDGNFFGDFGASFDVFNIRQTGQLMASPLLQLPGNLSTGFLVQLGPIGTTNPQLTVGVTEALRDQFPYAVPVSEAPGGRTYPVSGYPVLNLFGIEPQYYAQKAGEAPVPIGCDGDCTAPPLPTVIDSGAPSTSLRVTRGTPYAVTIGKNQFLKPGVKLVAEFPTTAGRQPLEWELVAGVTPSVDAVGYGGDSVAISGQNVNTGLNLYNTFDVMFDAKQQVIWLRPNDGAATVIAGSVTTTGDQTYRQNAHLGGTYSTGGGAFTVGGVTELRGDAVVSAGTGDVAFFGAVDGTAAGAQRLTVNSSGATTFTRGVGEQVALAAFTTDSGGTTASAGVTTQGDQRFGDPVALSGSYSVTGGTFAVAQDATLAGPVVIVNDTAGQGITFAGRIDGSPTRGYTLSLATRGGTVSLEGNVGATHPLGGLVVDDVSEKSGATTTFHAGGTINLDGGLGNAPAVGLSIAPKLKDDSGSDSGSVSAVTVDLTQGGVIQGFTGSGVKAGSTDRSVSGQISEFVITNNGGAGIEAENARALTISDSVILGNGGDGVLLKGSVGGDNAITGNTISANGLHGVTVDGPLTGNAIRSNSIFLNGPPKVKTTGISLQNGGNANQPAPDKLSAELVPDVVTGLVIVKGRVQSYSDSYTGRYTIQVFLSPVTDEPNVQGRQVLATEDDVPVGNFTFAIPVGSLTVAGSLITVTATPATGPANTSEFSEAVTIV